jgi:hypothetical protein
MGRSPALKTVAEAFDGYVGRLIPSLLRRAAQPGLPGSQHAARADAL